MRKKKSKSGRLRHSWKRQSPAWTTITFDSAMDFCLLHWVIVTHFLLNYHLPDNPNEQNQLDVAYFSQDHNRHIDLLNFASFIRENYTRETEMEETTKNY
jgi:hypothetical protein